MISKSEIRRCFLNHHVTIITSEIVICIYDIEYEGADTYDEGLSILKERKESYIQNVRKEDHSGRNVCPLVLQTACK